MFFDEQEIIPKIQGTYRFNANDERVTAYDEAASEIRALIEGQLLAKRLYSERLGFSTGNFRISPSFYLIENFSIFFFPILHYRRKLPGSCHWWGFQ